MTEEATTTLERYEHRTAAPMAVLAVAFLFVYGIPIVWDDAPTVLVRALEIANAVLWVLFIADLAARAVLSGKLFGYLVRHPIDVLLVALPMLRPLRALRVFTALQMLVRQGGRVSIGNTLTGAVAATALLMVIAALAILDAERGQPGANIETFGDALWWSGVTVTTVGYGDLYPVTSLGRSVGFAMMLVGVSMLGVVTASIAAWFVGRTEQVEEDLSAQISELTAKLDRLLAEKAPD